MDAIIHFSRRFLRIRAKINEDKAEKCQISFIYYHRNSEGMVTDFNISKTV